MEKLKTMGRRLLVLLALAALTAGLALPASADMGPKPSVELTLQGLEGESYYVTLLGDTSQYGPWSAESEYQDWMGEPDAFAAFAAYQPPEGWYFLGEYGDCTGTDRFVWSYYPPERFYILVWLPESGQYIRSAEPYARYAFDSYFTVQVTAEGLQARQSYAYGREAAGLLVRAALTIALELAAGWLLFGLRREQLALVLKVNLVTQLGLNLLLNLCGYFGGPMLSGLVYVLLELLVVLAEGAVYARRLLWPDGKKPHPWLYALGANLLSFAAGWELAHLLPGVF